MAISAPHYRIMREIQPLLPRCGTLLQIGEANWYGDIDPRPLFTCTSSKDLFQIANDFYADLFSPSRTVAIDATGSPSALKLNLNEPILLDERFDVVINHGTVEHIFNVAQVFRTVHERCEAGGLMIHEAPFHGWVDHGFYCLQPTLFYDLATANNYEVMRVYIEQISPPAVLRLDSRNDAANLAERGELPKNAMLLVVMKKLFDLPFKIPTQGYYARTIDEAGKKAWEANK